MSLQDEITKGAREIATDGYPMSIGELLNLYRDNELDLHPEFQRFFRWTLPQKSRLIESILLGIPLPSIFVFQRNDGKWDVIDGLQRLGSIFEFVGVLKNDADAVIPPTRLLKTRYLPSLEGKYWESEESDSSLTDTQRRIIKRAKIDIKIIKSDSSETSKYELFQRLNTGGTIAADQEVRNCLLIMSNRGMFKWIEELSDDNSFKICTALTERQKEERYDLELVLRFLILKDLNGDDLKFSDIGEFLTDRMLKLAASEHFNYEQAENAFRKTFLALVEAGLEEDAFRRYDATKERFVGSFTLSAFEAVAIGLGSRFTQSATDAPDGITDKIKALWGDQRFTGYSGSGIRANLRIPRIVPLGREIFGD